MNPKLKFYLSTDQSTHRKFYWFELDNYDLYWGNSSDTKIAFCNVKNPSSGRFIIQTPDDFKKLKLERNKYSYHESGQFHPQKLIDGKYSLLNIKDIWPKKNEIDEPYRIYSILSKPLNEYPIELKKLTRNNSAGKSILLEGEQNYYRIYFEIFLSKPGTYKNPASLINFGLDKQLKIYHKLSEEFTLFFRHTKIKNLENWFPDTEIVFLEK